MDASDLVFGDVPLKNVEYGNLPSEIVTEAAAHLPPEDCVFAPVGVPRRVNKDVSCETVMTNSTWIDDVLFGYENTSLELWLDPTNRTMLVYDTETNEILARSGASQTTWRELAHWCYMVGQLQGKGLRVVNLTQPDTL